MSRLKFIAEIGINHNGDRNLAMQMIKHAKECGCDIVKFQKRTPNICVPEKQKLVKRYGTPWGDISYLEEKQRLEFSRYDYQVIDAYCKKICIEWTASAWDIPSFEFLQEFDLPYHKIASPMLTNYELVKQIALAGRHTFISTGMSMLEDIQWVVDAFRFRNTPFELMHCVSCYPMQNEDANLRMIPVLRKRFGCDIGYSGHERGLQITLAAVALGATSVERHITLDRAMWGTDQAASVGPSGLAHLVRDCHIVRAALGDGVKKILPGEAKKRETLVT